MGRPRRKNKQVDFATKNGTLASKSGHTSSTYKDEEIARLRKENASLRQQLSDLQRAYEELHLMRTQGKEPWVHRLPPEVLRLVFSRAIPPAFLLDSSLRSGPRSSWCRATTLKKTIVRVCKTWYAVGIEWLYEDVALRRVYQLPLLLRTLETSPETFYHLVKSITIHTSVYPQHGRALSEHLRRVLDICPQLLRFVFASPSPLPAPLPTFKPGITHLVFDKINTYEHVLSEVCTTLVSLSFCTCEFNLSYTHLKFPRLENLSVCVSPDSEFHVSNLGSVWTMPSLLRVSFTLESARFSWKTFTGLESFCKRHGRQLKFLQFHPAVSYSPEKRYPFDIQKILVECPTLEHLVLHPVVVPGLSHQRIRWVDIWHPRPSDFPIEDLLASITKTSFPSLRGVRTLAASLVLFPTELPYLVPPLLQSDAADFEWQYPNVYLRQEHGSLSGGRANDIYDLEEESDSSDEYRYSSIEDESPSESESGRETSGSDHLSVEELWTPELPDSESEFESESERESFDSI